MTAAWRSVETLAQELNKTEAAVEKELRAADVTVIKGMYQVKFWEAKAQEPKRGGSPASGIFAINSILRPMGMEIKQHHPGNILIVARGNKRRRIKYYQNHYGRPAFPAKCGFLNPACPEYLLFISSPENHAWAVTRDDARKYFKGTKKMPEYMWVPDVPEEREEWTWGALSYRFYGGEAEQLLRPAQLGL